MEGWKKKVWKETTSQPAVRQQRWQWVLADFLWDEFPQSTGCRPSSAR